MPFQTFLRALALVAIFAASPHALAQAPAAGSTQPVDLTGRFNYPLSRNDVVEKEPPIGN